MGKYFGTDGFRGQANVGLTAAHAFGIGRFLGWYFGQERKARVVIGKDTRRSSYMYENALAAGLTASGADAHLLHVTTTPSVSYITRTEEFDCGIMISASHNPYEDNGIKLLNAQGEKMDDQLQERLERFLDGEPAELPLATGAGIGRTVDYYSGRNRYIGYLTGIATRSYEDRRVGLDCANGSTWMIGRAVFDALGAKSHVIGDKPDGTNINQNCGSTHMEGLQRLVTEQRLDVGFAFDGDGDRCLAVDEKGRVVNGDQILYVCAKYMSSQGQLPNNTVVTTVMSNLGLYQALDKLGIAYEKTDVGDRWVYENMKKNGHMLGGEQSGHVIFRKFAHTGDGLITAIALMEVLERTQLPLSALTAACPMLPQVMKNAVVADKEEALAEPAVAEACRRAEERLGRTGRLLLRKSGTEPLLRVMAEAPEAEEAERCVDMVIEAMRRCGRLLEVRQ